MSTSSILTKRYKQAIQSRQQFQNYQCIFCQHRENPPQLTRQRRHFTSTARQKAEEFPDHYATLSLPPTASTGEIKKSFYSLSKKHHPDRNPGDSGASARFVAISEAYHTLGSASARAAYDRDYQRVHSGFGGGGGGGGATRRGSYSSASGPAGARPPSGLSRRRTTFRGPPPSFYRNGAWGAHGAKRSAAQEQSSHTRPDGSSSSSEQGSHNDGFSSAYTGGSGGSGYEDSPFTRSAGGAKTNTGGAQEPHGFSAGQNPFNEDPHLPYWDKKGHFKTQEGIRQRQESRSSEAANGGGAGGGAGGGKMSAFDEVHAGGSLAFNFFAVAGILVVVVGVPVYVGST